MDFWADVWSFLTAVGTIGMAVATYVIIRQGRHQHEVAERQHWDRFRPICILMPYDGVDPLHKRGQLLENIGPSSDNPGFGTLKVNCALRNVGAGPALEVRIKFRFPNRSGWTTEPWEVSPLSAGENRGGTDSPLLIPIRIQDDFNTSDLAAAAGEVWEIWLEYEDVFGQRFCSAHHKSPVRIEERLRPVPEPVAGSGERFMYSLQPWATFPKCPSAQP